MKLSALTALGCFLCGFNFISAQIKITGSVLDSSNKQALAFVNVGIKNKNLGTISGADGKFTIEIPENYKSNHLTFYITGYSELSVAISDIINKKHKDFVLRQAPVTLPEPEIIFKKPKEFQFGIKSNPVLHFTDGSVNQDDIFEIAQVIKLPNKPGKLTAVNLLIAESQADSSVVRINFYNYRDDRPGAQIHNSILKKVLLKKGWQKFNVSADNILADGELVIGIEFIPGPEKKSPILYEVKIGGTSNSFVRKSSFGSWQVPPHHYRIFVSMIADSNPEPQDDEEKESAASFRIFSNFVKDTFSIFIKLPTDYKKDKMIKYRTAYLLDANLYYDVVSSKIKKLNASKDLEELILVGIGYKDFIEMDSLRSRDYTYPKAFKKYGFTISGGALEFRQFILSELLPQIDKRYRTDTNSRALMGHSLGGYFTLYSLQKDIEEKRNEFSHYISASPSLHYNDEYLIQMFREKNRWAKSEKKFVYLNMGELEAKEDNGSKSSFSKSFEDFVKLIAMANLSVTHLILQNSSHMETAVPGFEKGLKWFFEENQ